MVLVTIATILTVLLLVLACGALVAFVVELVSRFLAANLPSTLIVAGSKAKANTSVGNSQKSMEKVQNTEDAADAPDDMTVSGTDRLLNTLGRYSRYIALLAAWLATCGSLYMSEVLGWVPCLLCWYQRILMYPLALILPVGILRRDKGLHKYALVLSVPGAAMSLYHYLVQKVDLFKGLAPCRVGVPCSSDYLNWLGFITVPFLALTAFIIISFMVVASTLAQDTQAENEEGVSEDEEQAAPARVRARAPILPVLAIIIAVILSFLAAGVLYARNASQPVADTNTTTIVLATPDAVAIEHGRALFKQVCAECHGVNGEGALAGLAPLSASTLILTGTDTQLLTFLQAGRATNDAHNMTGMAMPSKGGRPELSNADLVDIMAYLRTLVQ